MELLGIALIIIGILGALASLFSNIMGQFVSLFSWGLVKHTDESPGRVAINVAVFLALLIIGIILIVKY